MSPPFTTPASTMPEAMAWAILPYPMNPMVGLVIASFLRLEQFLQVTAVQGLVEDVREHHGAMHTVMFEFISSPVM